MDTELGLIGKKMLFTFLFHDGTEIIFKADSCKHFTGHAALIEAEIIKNTKNKIPVGTNFSRFNIALNGELFGMYPTAL